MKTTSKPVDWMKTSFVGLIDSGRDASRLSTQIYNKPRLIRFWLLHARLAQITLLLFVLLMPTVIPAGADKLYDWVSPPEEPQGVGEQLSNFFERIKGNDQLRAQIEARQHTARAVLWSSSVVIVLLLFWLNLPKSVRRAAEAAQEHETLGGHLTQSHPEQSILHYREAIGLSLDPTFVESINRKLGGLQQSAATHIDKTIVDTSTADEQTIVVDQTLVIEADGSQPLLADRYQLIKLLGRGAMGEVQLARDVKLDREVAAKQLSPQLYSDEQFIQRFKQEALALAKLSHPNIVQVYDLVDEDSSAWIIMEYVKGVELSDRITPDQGMPIKQALAIARQLCEGLSAAHQQRVVHRDFKPSNVLITDNDEIKIMDFGLAKLAQSSELTRVGTIMGSPAYMSPEQAKGQVVDERTDIYSLGITLFQLLTGKKPFEGDLQGIIAQHLTAAPPSPRAFNDAIPEALETLILAMLAKQPDERPASMQQIAQQLAEIEC